MLGSPTGRTSLSITLHELRRPLTIISSYAQLLTAGVLGPLPDTADAAVEAISASTEVMMRMVSALAELSRLEDPDDCLTLEELHFDDIIRGAIEQVRTEAQLGEVEIRREVPVNGTVSADRRQVVLALTNMLSNAIKHSPGRETVVVGAVIENHSVRLTVSDRGPGFPAEHASRLFDKYYRSIDERRRAVPGSGLGLYIVRIVAERHGGTVSARSLGSNGAEFDMVLPLH